MAKNYNWLWATLNIIGIILTVTGMFGVIGMLSFGGAMAVFLLGTAMILLSMFIIFYNAFKLGLFKEPDEECKVIHEPELTDKKGE